MVVRIRTLVTWLEVPLVRILLLPVFRPAAVSTLLVVSSLILGLMSAALLLMGETVAQSSWKGVRGLAFLGTALLGKPI